MIFNMWCPDKESMFKQRIVATHRLFGDWIGLPSTMCIHLLA